VGIVAVSRAVRADHGRCGGHGAGGVVVTPGARAGQRVEGALDRGWSRGDVEQLERAEGAIRAALARVPEQGRSRPFYGRSRPGISVGRPAARSATWSCSPPAEAGCAWRRARLGTEAVCIARDRPGLLAVIAGACTVAGLSILSAQIFTRRAEWPWTCSPSGGRSRGRRAGRWVASEGSSPPRCRGSGGGAAVAVLLATRGRPPPGSADGAVRYTRVRLPHRGRVGAADRPGLLFDLASTLPRCP
jgi:hypothetical protein